MQYSPQQGSTFPSTQQNLNLPPCRNKYDKKITPPLTGYFSKKAYLCTHGIYSINQ